MRITEEELTLASQRGMIELAISALANAIMLLWERVEPVYLGG
jgi:hypothetical protein